MCSMNRYYQYKFREFTIGNFVNTDPNSNTEWSVANWRFLFISQTIENSTAGKNSAKEVFVYVLFQRYYKRRYLAID